ncbi:MAG TPA: FAD-binding protein, partial [Mariprofundaceae bacterium]|nr:FAD-binding protein [Mariprofundaceae bacterium]
MRYLVRNVAVSLGEDAGATRRKLARTVGIAHEALLEVTLVRKSLDARQKRNIHFLCSFEIETTTPLRQPLPEGVSEAETSQLAPPRPIELPLTTNRNDRRAIVVGAGPAGLFAALALVEAGWQVHLLERGKPVEARMRDIGRLRSRGELDPESNICFGEGGAGTYTDGKLYTRIKHPYLRWVLAEFVRFGARPDILVDAHPHLGTDKLVRIVRNMRDHLLGLGVDYRFACRVDDLLIADSKVRGVRIASGEEITAEQVVLATGHSARDTYQRLEQLGIAIEAKAFAIGVRAEHPQQLIDGIQFG